MKELEMTDYMKKSCPVFLSLLVLVLIIGCSSDDGGGINEPLPDTTAPAEISNFLALPGNSQVTLSWTNPQNQDLAGVEIRRATDMAPTMATGDVVYTGMAMNFVDDSVINDQIYYYAGFAFDNDDNYSAGVGNSCTPHVGSAVVFTDDNLELVMRTELGIPTGDITDLDMASLLDLNANGEDIADLQGLQHAINLTNLDLSSNDLTDASNTQLLAQLTELTDLHLSGNSLSILPNLSTLTKLLSLYIYANPITSLTPLAGVTSLVNFQFGYCDVADLTPLNGLENLERLRFQNCDVTSLAPLSDLPNLADLQVSHCMIGSASALVGIGSLTSLGLSYAGLSDLTPLAGMTQLVSLNLGGNEIDDVSALAGLTNLATLQIHSNEIEDVTPLAGLTALTFLEVGWSPLQDIAPLSGLTSLEYFNAAATRISDISILLGLSNLQSASLSNSPLTTDAVLIDIPALEAGGVTVEFTYEANLVQLMGPWYIGTITQNGASVDPGDFFEWDPATVTDRLTIFPHSVYWSEELDAGDEVNYFESGNMEVDGADLAVVAYFMDGVYPDPPEEVFSGTWAKSGDDLVFTMIEGADTVVMTWIR